MTKPKVFITGKIPKYIEDYISKHCDYRIWNGEDMTYDILVEEVKDAEGLLTGLIKIDENLLNHDPNLRIVSNYTVGYNNFDLDIMEQRGIIGTNAAGSSNDTVADLILGLIISTARRIPELDRFVKDGNWKEDSHENFYGKDISGSTIGIIGMGRIGEEVAKRAKLGFNMDVYYYNRSRKKNIEENLGVVYKDFKSLLQESDFVVTITPLTEETYHMMSEEEFSMMKKDSVFVNASRGKVVDENALINALESKKILAAGLDVFEQEPLDSDNPLLKMKNTITLPHIGASTLKTLNNMIETGAKNLVQGLKGEIPDNIVPELKNIRNN